MLPMVKTFMWKVCCNILTTRQNLKLNNVVQEAFCPIRKLAEEFVEIYYVGVSFCK